MAKNKEIGNSFKIIEEKMELSKIIYLRIRYYCSISMTAAKCCIYSLVSWPVKFNSMGFSVNFEIIDSKITGLRKRTYGG